MGLLRAYKRLSYWIKRILALLVMYLSVLIAVLRIRRNFIVRRYIGQHDLNGASKLAVFVHYDSHGIIHDFVIYYLEALRSTGYGIVFTSNSPVIHPDGLSKILPLCVMVLH